MNDDITWSLASTKISDCHSTCPTGLGPFPQCNKAIAGYQLSTKAPTGNALFRDTEKCPVGHFQSELSDSPCAPCPVGSYAGSEGSTSCTKCPTSAKYTKSAGTTSESGCYDVPPDCSANGVDARSCLFGAWGPQSFGEKWKLFENYGTSLTPTGTPSYTPDEIYKKFDSIQKEAVTTECSASTCKTPGQLCQVPGKNIYSCCVPYLTQEQWKKYYSKNGFGIDEYYQATNGQFKWASILPGGCLNNPYGSDSSNPLQSWSMGTLNDTGIPSEKNGIIPSALAMGWGEYSEGYETGTYTGKCPAAPPGIFASGGSFITNYRCKPSLSLAAGAPGGGFAGGTGSTVGHWSQGGKYWGNGNFPGYGLQITETNPNYSNPDSEAFEHTIHNRQVCAQFAEPVRQVGFQGGMKNRAGEMIGHPGSWFKSNGNCKGDSYSIGCNRQFQSAQTCCVPTLVLDGTGGSCDSSGKTPSYYVDT
tara:strand:- start:1467 stop:2891 length:1425 start_codon:yes stop_codon:yes gene_type:complete